MVKSCRRDGNRMPRQRNLDGVLVTMPILALVHTRREARWPRLVLAAALAAACSTSGVLAQAPVANGAPVIAMSAEDLENLVGRIALYPDDLVAIILPAATN